MREIGVRELKSRLSEILRAVDAGESVRVTHRGRAMADLTPPAELTAGDHLHLLIRQGRVQAATKPHSPPPARWAPTGGKTATEVVLEDREEDR